MMKQYESPEFSLEKYTLIEVLASTSEQFDNSADGDLDWDPGV